MYLIKVGKLHITYNGTLWLLHYYPMELYEWIKCISNLILYLLMVCMVMC